VRRSFADTRITDRQIVKIQIVGII
jgi:hypothetical protein